MVVFCGCEKLVGFAVGCEAVCGVGVGEGVGYGAVVVVALLGLTGVAEGVDVVLREFLRDEARLDLLAFGGVLDCLVGDGETEAMSGGTDP